MSGQGRRDPVFTFEPVLSEGVGAPPPQPDTLETDQGGPRDLPSLSRNSAARLVADLTALLLALISATVTARLLGPSGKGYYSSVVLLGGVFVVCFGAGLGESAIVLVGRGVATLKTAVAATMSATLALSLVGAFAFLAVARLVLGAETTNQDLALLFGGLLTAVNVQYSTMTSFLLAQERVVAVAGLVIATAAVSTAALWALLAGTELGVAAAVLGSVAGSTVVLVATVWLVRRSPMSLRPRWVPSYLRPAFAYGASLEVSNLLVLMTARLDLVLVYRLADASTAGDYSVALTVGTVVASVPTAVSYVSFPRLAMVGEHEARRLTCQVFRVGIVAALVCGGAFAVLVPTAIPLVFGEEYRGAVGPTLLLIPGGVLWSGQWILCRAAAARGNSRPLLVSFVVSFLTMISLDFVLIPLWEGLGGGLASLLGSVVGLGVSVVYYRRWGWDWRALVPGPADVVSLVGAVRHLRLPARS